MAIFLRLHSARRTTAFTLVELAIVLVIIGLIIGGALTAQQITQNARITSALQGIKAVQAAAQSYNQNYGALPGDDSQAMTRFNGKGIADKGDNNGIIGANSLADGFAAAVSGADKESVLFWMDLRASGLVKGDAASALALGNPFGGAFVVQNGAFSDGIALGTNVVCLNHIPGSAAQAIDQQLDDGTADKGTILGGITVTGAKATAGYDSNSTYVLCTPLL